MKKTLSILLITALSTPAFAAVGGNGPSASQSQQSQSQQSQSNQSQSTPTKLDPTNSTSTPGTGGSSLGVSAAVVGLLAVGVGVTVVLSTVKLIIKVSSRTFVGVAMNGERDKALNDIVAAYNAKGYNVTAQQVEEQINAVLDEHSDSEASWNQLFNDEEGFSREVFTRLTGEQV